MIMVHDAACVTNGVIIKVENSERPACTAELIAVHFR